MYEHLKIKHLIKTEDESPKSKKPNSWKLTLLLRNIERVPAHDVYPLNVVNSEGSKHLWSTWNQDNIILLIAFYGYGVDREKICWCKVEHSLTEIIPVLQINTIYLSAKYNVPISTTLSVVLLILWRLKKTYLLSNNVTIKILGTGVAIWLHGRVRSSKRWNWGLF